MNCFWPALCNASYCVYLIRPNGYSLSAKYIIRIATVDMILWGWFADLLSERKIRGKNTHNEIQLLKCFRFASTWFRSFCCFAAHAGFCKIFHCYRCKKMRNGESALSVPFVFRQITASWRYLYLTGDVVSTYVIIFWPYTWTVFSLTRVVYINRRRAIASPTYILSAFSFQRTGTYIEWRQWRKSW